MEEGRDKEPSVLIKRRELKQERLEAP